VGDAAPAGGVAAPKGIVRAGGGRRRVADAVAGDIIEAPEELEKVLTVTEEIESRTADEHSEAPHFKKESE